MYCLYNMRVLSLNEVAACMAVGIHPISKSFQTNLFIPFLQLRPNNPTAS